MELVAFIGTDKENWGQITALSNRIDSEKIFLVKNKEVSGFPENNKSEIISVDSSSSLFELKNEILEKLKSKLNNDFEVAVSLASGNGKEHMALISALLSIPVGIRLVAYTKEGIQFVN